MVLVFVLCYWNFIYAFSKKKKKCLEYLINFSFFHNLQLADYSGGVLVSCG